MTFFAFSEVTTVNTHEFLNYSMLQIACLSLLLSLTTVQAGVCAGCPTTQHVVDKEHLEMIGKAFKLLKEKNPNILLGSEASLVPES